MRMTMRGVSSAWRAARSGVLGAAVVTWLGACSVLPDAEPVTIYQLPMAHGGVNAAAAAASGAAGPSASTSAPSASVSPGSPRSRADWSLRVVKPASSAVTDSPRILVLRESNQVNAYQAVRWSDPAPALWRNRLTAAFVEDGRVSALSTDDAPAHADLELAGDLRSFQVEYQGAQPVVALRLDARLVRTGTRRIVASRSFMVMQPVTGSKVPEVVTAFGQAADALSAQVVDWTLTQSPAR
ncbi:ABC-type transport auxiliary lipoprotein family protein [Pigmentiphaga litoralis]|uniref:Cholesterol transport system auxiliary component n=1 Tax=Pigmentiphaga litoralis TaxID=516702 RepID=A0A7Y9IVR3_9BURK|nr:ABC-type transport auxiliary lipoprotein family protein [Pigmentiphaga litoralis]NYE22425.1 cholesterol transport system auxiliary component [Pigmentiphaga litoralis]NYE83960.1 cholesterol transport system auxiliary component [Pigmentiphaga litoralis]